MLLVIDGMLTTAEGTILEVKDVSFQELDESYIVVGKKLYEVVDRIRSTEWDKTKKEHVFLELFEICTPSNRAKSEWKEILRERREEEYDLFLETHDVI